jgi:hypothetical protein
LLELFQFIFVVANPNAKHIVDDTSGEEEVSCKVSQNLLDLVKCVSNGSVGAVAWSTHGRSNLLYPLCVSELEYYGASHDDVEYYRND